MMLGRERAPVRTEADISAALTELARRAPGTDAVLSAVRDAGARQQDGLPRTPGPRGLRGTRRLVALVPRPRWPQLAVAAVAAAAAIALAVALTPGRAPSQAHGSGHFPNVGSLPTPPGTGSPGSVPAVIPPGRDPSAASVAKAMLAAFDATASYLVVWTSVGYTNGHPSGTSRFWNWPAVPVPGQLEYTRSSYSFRAVAGVKGTGIKREDIGYTTVVPPPSRYGQNAYARVIVVCYAGTGCGYGRHNVPAGTWWTHTGMLGYMDFTPDPSGAELAREIAHGDWRILGHTRLRGHKAIKLAETRTGHFMPLPVTLWVSTATYLPLRMVWLSGSKTGEIDDWSYLRPTKANLAQLRVRIPAGYPRSG